MPGDQTYMDAFEHLTTTRLYEGGPIPFDKILWYAVDFLEMDVGLSEDFTTVISEMDMVYLKWRGKQTKKPEKPKTTPGPVAKTRPKRRR